MELRIIYTILIGIISGILGGAFGLGGSFVMLPGVILLNVVPDYATAVGTILFSLLPPVSLLAVFDYGKRGKIDYLIGTLLFIFYFIAAYIGAIINKKYDQKTLEYGCAFTFLLITIYFFYHAYNVKTVKTPFI
jgi:uncharacterized membrane protein YfcA